MVLVYRIGVRVRVVQWVYVCIAIYGHLDHNIIQYAQYEYVWICSYVRAVRSEFMISLNIFPSWGSKLLSRLISLHLLCIWIPKEDA